MPIDIRLQESEKIFIIYDHLDLFCIFYEFMYIAYYIPIFSSIRESNKTSADSFNSSFEYLYYYEFNECLIHQSADASMFCNVRCKQRSWVIDISFQLARVHFDVFVLINNLFMWAKNNQSSNFLRLINHFQFNSTNKEMNINQIQKKNHRQFIGYIFR